MLSADDHSGVFSCMVGIVVLVMAGVGLSLVVDKRLRYSSGSVKLEKEMILEASELEGLIARHEESTRCLDEAEERRRSGVAVDGLGSEDKVTLKERQSVLEVTQERLRESINKLDKDFTQYRTDYRRQVRQAAIGESMGNITLRSGREYKQVEINQVTDVGLEIRHADGIARIQAPDLDQKIRDRFQWSEEDRKKVLESEAAMQTDEPAGGFDMDGVTSGRSSEPFVSGERRLSPSGGSAAAELALLRQSVIRWRNKVAELSTDRVEAQSRASYGDQKSVPGNLETWAARSERIGKELVRAQSALAHAEASLAAIAPQDPFLKRPSAGF